MSIFKIFLFEDAFNFIEEIPEQDKAKVLANMKTMETHFDIVTTKMLQKPTRELKVKKYRFLFFIERDTIYFTHGFVKKSQKTPRREISKTETIWKSMF